MWAHRPWVGRYLPADTRSGHELHAYSRLFNTVEGNTTFYATPSSAIVQRWCEQAHPDFRFIFKIPRHITHDRRLRDVRSDLASFCDTMSPLGDRVGGFTLQLPGSFGPSDLDALDVALRDAPPDWRWSVEVRHPSFCGAARVSLERLLEGHGAERVVLDTEPLYSAPATSAEGRDERDQKPRLPTITEALTDHPIVRCIGHDDPAITSAGLTRWQSIVADWLREGRSPTVFAHTPTNLDTPGFVFDFHDGVRALVPALSALVPAIPRPGPEPEQGTLF